MIGSEVEAVQKDPHEKLCGGLLFVCNKLPSDTICKDKRSLRLGSMIVYINLLKRLKR